MVRNASAVWMGSLKEGKGTLTTQSSVLSDTPYSFHNRFGDEPGTNPEELVGAAHSGCFAMAFSATLGEAGFTPNRLSVRADVTLEPVDGKPTVTKSHLTLSASIDGIDEAKFQELAASAKAGCPISRLLTAEITLDATLEA